MSDWKEVDWFEAANAFKNETHEVERLCGVAWCPTMTFTVEDIYRIREKPRTITLIIPVPWNVEPTEGDYPTYGLLLSFITAKDRDEALTAFRNAWRA